MSPALTTDTARMSTAEVQRLVRDLQIEQAKLQLRNQQLRQSWAELAQTRDRFDDLFEFAPVGYLLLEPDGVIRQANQTAAELLATERSLLAGRNFSEFIAAESQDTWFLGSAAAQHTGMC